MATTWRDERRARVLDQNRQRPVAEIDDDDLPDCLIRSREVIVNELALSLVPLTAPAYSELTSDFPEVAELDMHLFHIDEPSPTPSPDDTRQLVEDLLARTQAVAEERGIDPGLVVVSLHYVWGGQPRYQGGPGDVPHPADTGLWPQAEPPRPPLEGDPVAAALDTGYAAGSTFNLAPYLRLDPTDTDPLYLAPATMTLGPEGGHGTFVAGVLVRMSGGGISIDAGRALDDPSGGGTDGFGDDASVARELLEMLKRARVPRVINMSFSTTTTDGQTPPLTRHAMARFPSTTVFVAAAGTFVPTGIAKVDDRTRLAPRLPAADPRVVGVASVEQSAGGTWVASPFTPWGPWVDVCTFGERILSTYVNGEFPGAGVFNGVATWAGTSFAAPVFAAEVLRRSLTWNVPAATVCQSLIASLAVAGVPGAQALGRLYDPRSQGIGIDPRFP